ncbi:MAG: GNAT family N-acetyltransferase [Chloroflexi bacterium]|nr:GNAT family N-acetyltransferase [Chloroflexota bacterium]
MIVGKKVRLRAIERSDIPTFVRWFNDREVTRYLNRHEPMSMAEEERWFERQVEHPDGIIYAIETMDGIHIGNIGLHGINWKNRSATLGIIIGEKDYWGQGYGSDAIRTLLSVAFEEMNLNRVELVAFDFNARAIRCYEKCGFTVEGREREVLFREGKYHDQLRMSILQREFSRANPGQ